MWGRIRGREDCFGCYLLLKGRPSLISQLRADCIRQRRLLLAAEIFTETSKADTHLFGQSIRFAETPTPNPTCYHISPYRRRYANLRFPRRLHSPRESLPTVRRHLYRPLEQIPDRLLHPLACPAATTAHTSPTRIPERHAIPSRRPKMQSAVAENSSMAIEYCEWVPKQREPGQ